MKRISTTGSMCNIYMHLIVLVFYIDYAAARCKVVDISVQQNFDIKKYAGVTWYEQKWLPTTGISPEELHQDYQQTYYLHPDGTTITIYANGRNPADLNKCFYYSQVFRTSDTPGKWLAQQGSNTHADFVHFWIISTDYTSYSVVYRCVEYNSDGECILSKAWVFSRSPQLRDDKQAIVDSVLGSLCINTSALVVTQQTLGCPVDKDCTIYSIAWKRRQNFNLQRFVGKWYRTAWLPGSEVPSDEMHHDYQYYFVPDSQNTLLTVFTRARAFKDIETCNYFQGQLLPTQESGKFTYRRRLNSTYILTSDFWVMYIDNVYVTYAIMYGCRLMDQTGRCVDPESWILSRYPAIPKDQKDLVDSKIKGLCLNTSAFLPTEQNNECPEFRDCSVATIVRRMVQNFDRTKFMGRWYKYSYLHSSPGEPVTDYQMTVLGPIDSSDTQITVTKTRARYTERNDRCEYDSHHVKLTDHPGKEITTHKTPRGNITEVISYIMATDYTSYAVEYSCEAQDSHFRCSKPIASIWSRSQDLSMEHLVNVNMAIIGLCLNNDDFIIVEHSHPCPELALSEGSSTNSGARLESVQKFNQYLLICISIEIYIMLPL